MEKRDIANNLRYTCYLILTPLEDKGLIFRGLKAFPKTVIVERARLSSGR